MQISGRNKLAGKVTGVKSGMLIGEVELDLGNGQVISGIITKHSLDEMNIKEGDSLTALIKATSVMFIKD